MVKKCNIKGSVKENFSNILSRPFISVYSYTKLFEIIPFFAIGPDIYADGLLVTSKNRIHDKNEIFNDKKDEIFKELKERSNEYVEGRISSKHLLLIIVDLLSERKSFTSLYNLTAAEIMDVLTEEHMIESDTTVSKVLDIFKKTGFAFLPIVKKTKNNNLNSYKMLSYLSVRDFLPLFLKKKKEYRNFDGDDDSCLKEIIDIPVKEVSSKLISVYKNSLLGDVINTMLSKKIRNIGILNKNSKLIGILNDRKILELMARSKDKFTPRDNNTLDKYSKLNVQGREFKDCTLEDLEILNNFKIPLTIEIKKDSSISIAANQLNNLKHSYLILEGNDRIVTPWDIVMKTLS